jgi:hypothetical protein
LRERADGFGADGKARRGVRSSECGVRGGKDGSRKGRKGREVAKLKKEWAGRGIHCLRPKVQVRSSVAVSERKRGA